MVLFARHYARLATILLLSLVVVSCGTSRESNVSEAEISAQEKVWDDTRSLDYTLVYSEQCFCSASGEVTVVVRDGRVEQAYRIDASNSRLRVAVTNPYTVNGLFDLVRRAHQEADELTVRFDDSLGYPVSISIDWIRLAADDEYGLSVVRLTRQ